MKNILLAFLLASSYLYAVVEETTLQPGEIPKAVLDAAMKKLPDVKIDSAKKLTDGPTTIYEIKMGGENGQWIVVVPASADRADSEQVIQVTSIPHEVMVAFTKKYDRANFDVLTSFTRQKDSMQLYKYRIETPDHYKLQVTYDMGGQLIEEAWSTKPATLAPTAASTAAPAQKPAKKKATDKP